MYLNVLDGLWKASYEEVQTSLPKDNRLYATYDIRTETPQNNELVNTRQ